MVNPLGKELLLLLDEQTNPGLRSWIIDVLQEIEYTAALPRLRKLAIEDSDPEIRARAEEFVMNVEYLERMDHPQ